MRLLLDLQVLQSESRGRGIGRYSRGLAGAFLRSKQLDAISALLNPAVTRGLAQRQRSERTDAHAGADVWDELENIIDWLSTGARPADIRVFQGMDRVAGMLAPSEGRLAAAEALYDAFLKTSSVDLVHQATAFDGFGDNTIVGGRHLEGPARAITVYDLIPFEDPDFYLADTTRRNWYFRRLKSLETADLLLTISEHTRKVVVDRLKVRPDQVVSIGTDADPLFRKQEISPERRRDLMQRYGLQRPFLMHVGILEERKNVAFLIKAFAALPPEIRTNYQVLLVAEATTPQKQSLAATAQACGLEPANLVFPGFVSDQDLVDLYQMSAALVMPSLSEGFGLPVLEAMRSGAAVLASNATSLPEVVGSPDLLFDPHDPAQLTQKLHRLLVEPSFRAFALSHGERQEKQFSWDRSAEIAQSAFENTIERRRHTQQRANGNVSKYLIVPSLTPNTEGTLQADWVDTETAQFQSVDEPNAVITTNILANERALLQTPDGELDLRQQALLARMPAVILTAAENIAAPSRELLYGLSGYSALLSQSSPIPAIAAESLSCCFSQLVGVLKPTAPFADIEASFEAHFSATILETLSCIKSSECDYQAEFASALYANQRPAPARRRLFVDISELKKNDAKSGIQRVVRNLVRELLCHEQDFRIEPIFRDDDQYRYAREFTCKFLRVEPLNLDDSIVDFHPSDVYLGLDLDLMLNQGATDRLREFRLAGGEVNFVVYDILPLRRPDWFVPYAAELFPVWLDRIVAASTRLIAISQTVSLELREFLAKKKPVRPHQVEITWYHNGADLDRTFAAIPYISDRASKTIEELFAKPRTPLFLTVGTVEPRKGIGQLIDAAEHFWREQDGRFVIVGKHGWLVDQLAIRIRSHPELQRRLFWFEQASDEVLSSLYRVATALIMPSEAEGFGLPLVEAARHGVPIIARDLPVFREVGGEGAFYFSAESGETLGRALTQWLALHRSGKAPHSKDIRVLSWEESATELMQCIKGERSDA